MRSPDHRVHRLLTIFNNVAVDLDERAAALNDQSVPLDVVMKMVAAFDPDRREIALAVCERSQGLATWATVGSVEERTIIAFNPFTPAEALRRLAHDAADLVRAQVPFNPNTEPHVLAEL